MAGISQEHAEYKSGKTTRALNAALYLLSNEKLEKNERFRRATRAAWIETTTKEQEHE
jgi:hypothetical protein